MWETNRPTAAIWWRVSTEGQKEISPDTQKDAALCLADQEGYYVPAENVIGADWGSLSVWDSPAMPESVHNSQLLCETHRPVVAEAARRFADRYRTSA